MGGQGSGTNPNSQKNLKRRKPGQSGNPSNRYASLTQALRKIGFEADPYDESGATNIEVAARVMWRHGNHGFNGQGSPRTIEAIASRLDGKPAETVTVNATIAQLSPEEHAQQIIETLQRVKQQHGQSDRPN